MPVLERALESMATKGSARGADVLIERLELELSSPDPIRRLRAVRTGARGPLAWRKGLVIALATSAVVLVAVAVGSLLAGLIGASSPDIATPVTTQAPSDESLVPDLLFDGMVLRDGDVIGIFQDGGFVPLVQGECCVDVALSDLAGGVVFQRDENAVLWAPTDGDAGTANRVILVEAQTTERVSLQGVAVIGGEPTVVFVRFEPAGDGEQATLATVGLVSGVIADVVVLSEGAVVVDRVSYAGGRYLVSIGDGDGTRFEFREDSGAVVDVAGNPWPMPTDTLVGQGVLTNDGRVMIFIERLAEDAGGGLADLVTFDLERGVELSRDHIANFGDRIVAFDGERVIIARQRANPELPSLMVGLHLSEGATLSEGRFSQGGFSSR